MKKVMLLAAMLAMVLAAAAPAFAQEVTEQDCTNILGDINVAQENAAVIAQYGDDDLAAIAQENGTTIDVVQNCVNAVDSVVAAAGDDAVAAGDDAVINGVDDDGDGVVDDVDEAVVLPDTGGSSLFALGAGTLLVAGGLLARRMVR